jgi:hypothetical protein
MWQKPTHWGYVPPSVSDGRYEGMNSTSLSGECVESDVDPRLSSAHPPQCGKPDSAISGTAFRLTTTLVGGDVTIGDATTVHASSPADLIQAVWRGVTHAHAYELVITPVEDDDDSRS